MCWVTWEAMALSKYVGGLGYREIETNNDALLAKIGWRLIKDPHSLLSQVLMGKYAQNYTFMDCPTPATMSHGWRSILAGREILRKGLSWVVGDGKTIRIWDDPWLSFKAPCQPMGPSPLDGFSLKVNSLLCSLSNKSDIEKIMRLISQYENTFFRIKTSSTPSPDTLIWLPEKSGEYSTKTGYGIAMTADIPLETIYEPVNWLNHIWNVKTSPKLKDFYCRVAKKAISVSSNLERRGFPSFNCKKCSRHEDDLHILLKCPLAEEV